MSKAATSNSMSLLYVFCPCPIVLLNRNRYNLSKSFSKIIITTQCFLQFWMVCT